LFDFDGEYEDELSFRVSVHCSVWSGIGTRESPMASSLDCGSSGTGSSPGWFHCVSASLYRTQVYKLDRQYESRD